MPAHDLFEPQPVDARRSMPLPKPRPLGSLRRGTSPAKPMPHPSAPLPVKALKALVITVSCAFSASAQEADPQRYIYPMDIPVQLSGNFMELRPNHFHSGLDFRTQGREGIPVKAVADGWVSRIKISPWGYGKAVYIDHPTGHTSVYGHLSELKGMVAGACLDAQYRARDFSIDVYPEKGSLPVKQGEVIALSGNTGGSAGPHLHFELRRSSNQHALDPQALGMQIKDSRPPEISGLRIYPLTDSSRVGPYPPKAVGFATQGGDGRYTLKPGLQPTAYGTVGLAINTFDRYDDSPNKCGVRRIELLVDSVPVFSTHLDHVDFDHNRYCNAHMDHALFKRSGMDYHRCYRLPNNKLRIYGREPAQGRIALEPGREHHVQFIVHDAAGNRTELAFLLRGATLQETLAWPEEPISGSLLRYDTENVVTEEGMRLTLPPLALYDDTFIRYERRAAPAKALGPVHVVGDPETPMHLNCELRLDLPELPQRHRNKALVVSMDKAGKPKGVGGTYREGAVVVNVKSFGAYTTMLDTVPPVIANVDLRADMKGRSTFRVKISDDLSGIDKYRGTINGQWLLLEYEPKSNTLTHTFDKHTSEPGAKEFKLEVTDERGNKSEWSLGFTR
jgi:murein DD-endopeptidase MepM/ murein hydrolase activator NlpD